MAAADDPLAGPLARLRALIRQPPSPGREAALAEVAAELERAAAAVGTQRDDLRATNERLQQVEQHYRELFNATYDGIFVVDAESGRILEANEQACALLGYPREELLRLSASDLHPYELSRFWEFVHDVGRHGRWRSYELTCRTRRGELIPAQLSASAVVFEGRPCVLTLVHDLRTHRLAEIGQAVGKIGHDLRNILATVQLLADSLAASDDPEVQRITPRLIDSVDRAIQLCVDTLAPGHVRKPPLRRTRFRLRQVVEDAAATAGVHARPDIAWRDEVPGSFRLHADADQLFRVLLNLVRNACEAMGRGGEIRVSATRMDGSVQIEVSDTGPGLPDAVRERLFQPFASGRSLTGTGLGLAIARDLMQAHGGAIELASTGPEGTTFRLLVPDG